MVNKKIIERLSEKGKNPKIFKFAEKGIKKGMSFKSIIYEFKKKGLGYRNKDIRRDLRIISAELGIFDYLKKVKKSLILDESYFKKLKYPTPKKFNITFKVEIFNLSRKTEEVRFITVGTDEYKKYNDYIDMVYEIIRSKYEELIINKITPVKAFGWW